MYLIPQQERKAWVSPITASETPGGGDISMKVVATLPASRLTAAGLAGREGSWRRGRAGICGHSGQAGLFGILGGLGPGFSPPCDVAALAVRTAPLCTVPGRDAAAYGFAGAPISHWASSWTVACACAAAPPNLRPGVVSLVSFRQN